MPRNNQIRELPFHDLTWKEFELLVLDIVDASADVDGASLYGVEGSTQEGIDIYAPLTTGGYDVIQCKRVRDFGPSKIKEMIDLFLGKREDGSPYVDEKGNTPPPLTDERGNVYPRWPTQTRTFILAISSSLDTPQKQRELEKAKVRLKTEGIAFRLWDPRQLNSQLKKLPKIVDLHFSRAMVQAFCGKEASSALGPLSEAEMHMLQAMIQSQIALLDQQKDLAGEVQAIYTAVTDLRQEGVHISSQSMQGIQDMFKGLNRPKEPEAPVEANDTFGRQLEVLRTHVNAGHGSTDAASAMLSDLLPQVTEQPMPKQAQFYRIKGAFHYNVEQYEECADAYDKAYELDPGAETATRLKAMAHLLREEGAPGLRYLRQAQAAKPDDEDIQVLLVEALTQTGNLGELEKVEQELQPEHLELGLQLARKHMQRKDWTRMEAVLGVLSGGPHADDPHLHLLIGKLHLYQLADDSRVMTEAVRALKAQRSPSSQQAEEHLNRAVNGLDRGDVLRALRTEALNARQVLRCVKREHRQSLSDAHKALLLDPSLTGVQHNLAIAHLRLNEPHAALQVLDEFGEAVLSEIPASSIIFAHAARQTGDLQRALQLVETAKPQTSEHYRIDLLNEHVHTLVELKRVAEARALMDAEISTSPLAYVTRAVVDLAENDHAQAERNFEESIHNADPDDIVTRVDYASYLDSRGKADQAVSWLAALDLTALPEPWLDDLIAIFYRGHAFAHARAAIRERRSRSPMQKMMPAVIDAHLDALDGDLASAIPKLTDAVARWPTEPWPKMHLATAYTRLGEREKARPFVKQLSLEQKMPWWMFLEASKTASLLNMPTEARDLAYQAVRRGFEHEETHANFFGVMRDFKEKGIRPIVRPETAVQLEEVGGSASPAGPRWVVITRDPDPQLSRGEHALEDPFSMALLGRAQGEKVTLATGQTMHILQVVSKFSNAERVWITEGRTLFPLSRRVQQFRIGELEVLPQGLWEALKQQNESDQALQGRVQDGVFPPTFLGGLRSMPESTLWNWWMGGPAANRSCLGLTSEAQAAARAVKARQIIIHSSALAVLHRAGLLRRLAQVKSLVVTRATLDDLSAAQDRAVKEEASAPLRRLDYSGGAIRITEDSVETLKADRLRLDALLKFVRSGHVTIRPDLGLTDLIANDDLAAHAPASASVFLAAKTTGLPVLCDDQPLAASVRDSTGFGGSIDAICSLALVRALLEAEQIDETKFTRWTVALAGAGQYHLPHLTSEIVGAVLEENELKRNPTMSSILLTISRKETTLQNLAEDTSLLLKNGLLHYPLPESQEVWMREVLDAVIGDRPLPQFYRALQRSLDQRLNLAPIQHTHAIDVLRRWARVRWDPTIAPPLDTLA
ncbi:tetratricopeptide repeat protein [Deinococcus aquaticus]|uniref:tetratricopeptide repeat protein n=1 Tax=Deinococcus aquaticus TaxID=328692 RepID=UPI003F47BB1B